MDFVVPAPEPGSRKQFHVWIPIVRARIRKRISRIEEGNLGDFSPVGEGVFELRLMFGPGYRIYFGEQGKELIILINGGDKSSQKEDIRKAIQLWGELKESK